MSPVGGGDAEPFQQHRAGQQAPDPAGELGGVPGRHQHAGRPVDHRVQVAAERRGDHRRAAGHGLQARHAERLVPGHVDHQVGRAEQGRHVILADLAGELDPVRDAEAAGQPGQVTARLVLAQHRPRRAADDQQLRVGDVGQRAHGRLQAVPAQVGGHRDQPRPLRARRDGAFGAEPDGVHAERHHADRGPRDAQAGEVGHLVGAGRDHRVRAAGHGPLEPAPGPRLGLGASPARPGRAVLPDVVAALGGAQRVERLHDREAPVTGTGQRGQAAGPADRVHDVRLVPMPGVGQAERERPDVGQQGLVGQHFGRAGRDVLDPHSAGQLVLVRQVRRVLAGVDGHVMVLAGQGLGQHGYAGLLGGRLAAHRVGEGRGFFGD